MMTNEFGLKRSMASDSEDVLDEDDGSVEQHSRKSDRKRRRGIVEKRRRDRINQSLGELRRLVPAAFEKQGSAKLEKAEILQMTVDHLKMLHAKGLNSFGMHDTAALAMDYRSVGFRECAAEVARYMVSVEGLDLQDPLRMRLMNHLQCYSAQRDAASKASLHSFQPWSSSSFNAQYPPANSYTGVFASQPTPPCPSLSAYPDPSRSTTGSQQAVTSSSSQVAAAHALSGLSQLPSTLPPPNPLPPLSPSHYPIGQTGGGGVKPYRPWGAELAY